jgi:predicted enzyme related to lactoylglutathione lyase
MSTHFDLVTIDTPSPDPLAAFWSSALSLHEIEREDGDRWIVLGETDGTRRFGFQKGHHRAGSLHLDLACELDAFESERRRLLALGAVETGPPRREPYGWIANLLDPDGNCFDLCAYG